MRHLINLHSGFFEARSVSGVELSVRVTVTADVVYGHISFSSNDSVVHCLLCVPIPTWWNDTL